MKNINKTPKKIENVNDDGNKSVRMKNSFSKNDFPSERFVIPAYFEILDSSFWNSFLSLFKFFVLM